MSRCDVSPICPSVDEHLPAPISGLHDNLPLVPAVVDLPYREEDTPPIREQLWRRCELAVARSRDDLRCAASRSDARDLFSSGLAEDQPFLVPAHPEDGGSRADDHGR